MKDSRRPATWRFVAMMVVLLLSSATVAFAQTRQLRVKIGPATIYERPRTGSEVMMVAPEGTVLEVLGREDNWYWVILPPDANGLKRSGYIAVYVAELVSPVGPDVVPKAGSSPATKPPAVKPAESGPQKARYFASIGAGGQTASPSFADSVSYSQYYLPAHFDASYTPTSSSAIDATLGLRLGRRFVLAVAFWHSSSQPAANVTASIPHPFLNFTRVTTASDALAKTENDGHLQFTWLIPLSPRADLSVFGGPSLFYVRQALVAAPLALNETYDNVNLALPVTRVTKSKGNIGANAGFDLTVMVWRYFGAGVSARYARSWMKMASAYVGTMDVKVGGAQISGGLRVRF